MALKLRQGQVWKHGDEFIRIVRLERLEVAYKVVKSLEKSAGRHEVTSKKDFCRLLKACTLLDGRPLEADEDPTPLPGVPPASAAPQKNSM